MEDGMSRIISLLLFLLICGVGASAQSQMEPDALQKRLAELNAAINDLEAKASEINSRKNVLEGERQRILSFLAHIQVEDDFKNQKGYVVVRVDDSVSVTLLVSGREKSFRLFGIVSNKPDEGKAFLKKRLVAGIAYIRCQDSNCMWGYLYDQKEAPSLNAELVNLGYASTLIPDALDERKYTFTGVQQSEETRTAPDPHTPTTSSSTNTSKSSPGSEVQVKGYYRKDGTYVKPHTRGAPKRKP
jgi:hypothetical protein